MRRRASPHDLETLLSCGDPWPVIGQIAAQWTPELAAAVEDKFACLVQANLAVEPGEFASASRESRKRLVWLLERAKATDVLLRRLSAATGDEAAQILRALNRVSVRVSSKEILRFLLGPPSTLSCPNVHEEAIVATGLSGDVTLASHVAAFLQTPSIGRHAALALALLKQRDYAGLIASRIRESEGLDASGFLVALEVMNDASVVPQLLELMSCTEVDCEWEIHHALCHLTGKEPLIRLTARANDAAQACADAWLSFDLTRNAKPRLEALAIDAKSSLATFQILDGTGALRIDFDPPTPGATWPRWSRSLFAGDQKLYAVGSLCETCETTLQLTGSAPGAAAIIASDIRRAFANLERLDSSVFETIQPYLSLLRTGHYLAAQVDLDLERVASPEDSWLTRCKQHRVGDDPFLREVSEFDWPGTEHYQVREPSLGEVPTYGIVLPMTPLTALEPSTVERYVAAILSGEHPTALAMTWLEQKHVRGDFTERFLVSLVLDGHHKLAAYARLGRPARILALCRIEDSWGPPEDRSRWLREGLRWLGGTK